MRIIREIHRREGRAIEKDGEAGGFGSKNKKEWYFGLRTGIGLEQGLARRCRKKVDLSICNQWL